MKGIKNFIAKLSGIRGFLRKWRNMLAEIHALKKESAGLKKQITVLKKKNADFSGKVKQLNAEKKIMNTELTKADRQMKKLRNTTAPVHPAVPAPAQAVHPAVPAPAQVAHPAVPAIHLMMTAPAVPVHPVQVQV